MKNDDNLGRQVEQRVKRLLRAEQERPTVLGQTAYLGTLGLLLVLPVIGGAYLGRWLDGMVSGYSIRWTISLIFLGLVIGGVNVYLLIREP
jgi:ATP synthase protein I